MAGIANFNARLDSDGEDPFVDWYNTYINADGKRGRAEAAAEPASALKRVVVPETQKTVEEQIADLRARYERDTFRIGSEGRIQVLRGKKWFHICRHNKIPNQCKACVREIKRAAGEPIEMEAPMLKPDLGYMYRTFPGHQFRVNAITSNMQRLVGKIWMRVCGHNIAPCQCGACIRTHFCIEHDIFNCPQCLPGYYCECRTPRRNCVIHGGNRRCKDTGKLKSQCLCGKCSGKGVCPRCKIRLRQKRAKGLTCVKCSDGFVPTPSQCSKAACRFIDQLERHLGVKLQHHHLNIDEARWEGEEHQLVEWRKKAVDGYNEDLKLVVEYFGGDVHGHPSRWENNPDEVDRNGRKLQRNYAKTIEMMQKVKSLGYRVIYVWDADVNTKTGISRLPTVYREFIDHLEWE